MDDIKNKRLTVLNETVEVYSKPNTRAAFYKDEMQCDYCEYITNDGRKCAVGRLVTDEKATELEDIGGAGVDDNDLFNLLPTDVKELGQDFLIHLQGFHDEATNWSANGLTNNGKGKYNHIKKTFC